MRAGSGRRPIIRSMRQGQAGGFPIKPRSRHRGRSKIQSLTDFVSAPHEKVGTGLFAKGAPIKENQALGDSSASSRV
jgi:hypothetical protein